VKKCIAEKDVFWGTSQLRLWNLQPFWHAISNASGDGMEHRQFSNAFLRTGKAFAEGGMKNNMAPFAHEFLLLEW